MFRYVLKPKASSSIRGLTTCIRSYSGGFYHSCRLNGLGSHETRSHGLRCFPTGSHTLSQTSRCISSLSLNNDTIYALSSAQGRAGISVIRISGPGCKDVSPLLARISHVSVTNVQPRYTTPSVPPHHSPNPVTQRCGPSTNPRQQT